MQRKHKDMQSTGLGATSLISKFEQLPSVPNLAQLELLFCTKAFR